MTSPDSPPAEERPDKDPFAADRAFEAAYTGLANFQAPPDDPRFDVVESRSPYGGTRRTIYALGGDGKHSVVIGTVPGMDGRKYISVSVKNAPADGVFTEAVEMVINTGWDARGEESVLTMRVDRGPVYGPEDAAFMQGVGLGELCPDELVQTIAPEDDHVFQVKPEALTHLPDVPQRTVEAPQG